jgi:serine/threonine-protein phosphatase 2A regulatory subunit A
MGSKITESDLLPSFCNLLQDAESEVRTVAAKNIQGFQELVGAEVFVKELVPIMQVLAQDTVLNVRVALAEACMGVAPKLEEEAFMVYVVPLLMHFLRDEAPEVRLNVLSRLSDLSSWIEALSTSLLPVVMELKEDPQWRVRQSIASIMPTIAEKMGANYFQQNLLDNFFSGFSDEVAAVRMATSRSAGFLVNGLGADVVAQTFVPRLNEIWHDPATTYFVKMNVLFACKSIAEAQLSGEKSAGLMSGLKTLVVKGLQDDVGNVQFTAADCMAVIAQGISDSEKAEVKLELDKLKVSEDTDVIFFVTEALTKCE